MKNIRSLILLFVSALGLMACSGGSSGGSQGGGNPGPSLRDLTSPNITADAFVSALNTVDRSDGYAGAFSEIELYSDETYRSTLAGQDEWFVIWDDKFEEYKAVSLQYVRTIVYVDYVQSNTSLAGEFRDIETDDIESGYIFGDPSGDDYEVVEYDSSDDYFYGVNSGYAYEDESETTDVNLMAAQAQEKKFFKKAAAVSFAFNMNFGKAMSLVTLGSKVESMMNDGDLSAADMLDLSTDLQGLTGVTLAEVYSGDKAEVLEKVATGLGTSAASVEQKLLPELFGIKL